MQAKIKIISATVFFIIMIVSIIGILLGIGIGLDESTSKKEYMDSLKVENLKLENEKIRLELLKFNK